MKYFVILERTGTACSVYSPNLDGCVTMGRTHEEVEEEVEHNLREALEFHVEGMRQEGDAVPEARSVPTYVEVAA